MTIQVLYHSRVPHALDRRGQPRYPIPGPLWLGGGGLELGDADLLGAATDDGEDVQVDGIHLHLVAGRASRAGGGSTNTDSG